MSSTGSHKDVQFGVGGEVELELDINSERGEAEMGGMRNPLMMSPVHLKDLVAGCYLVKRHFGGHCPPSQSFFLKRGKNDQSAPPSIVRHQPIPPLAIQYMMGRAYLGSIHKDQVDPLSHMRTLPSTTKKDNENFVQGIPPLGSCFVFKLIRVCSCWKAVFPNWLPLLWSGLRSLALIHPLLPWS